MRRAAPVLLVAWLFAVSVHAQPIAGAADPYPLAAIALHESAQQLPDLGPALALALDAMSRAVATGHPAQSAALAHAAELARRAEPGITALGIGSAPTQSSPARTARAHRAIEAHRAAIAPARRSLDPTFDLWIDLNALRRVEPESAADGRIAQSFAAWRVRAARTVGVHITVRQQSPPLPSIVEIDVSFESRRDAPGTMRSLPITPELDLPAHVAASPAGAAWVAVVPVEVERWAERVAGLTGGCVDATTRARLVRLDALLADRGSIAAIAHPDAGHAVVALLPLARGRAGSSVNSDVRAVLLAAGASPRYDAAARLGSATLGPGLALEWTMAGPGYGHTLVLSATPGAAAMAAAAIE